MAHGTAVYHRRRSRGLGTGSADESRGGLNSLPDPLLHHILSFLPTKEVVQTSLVSRRWRDVWTHVPVLDFDRESFSRKVDFLDFVDRVFEYHRVARLQKFLLSFSDISSDDLPYHEDHDVPPNANGVILRCVCYIAEHFIEEFDLDLCLSRGELELPDLLFRLESLTVMKLKLDQFILEIPNSIHLPRLKDLELLGARLRGSSFQQLLSGCPKLEKLSINDCELEGFEIMDFSGCSCLEILRMENCFRFEVDLDLIMQFKAINISCHKLRTLIIHSFEDVLTCEIKISAPNLQYFKYDNCLPRTFSIERLSSLVKAHITFFPLFYYRGYHHDDGYPLNKRVINTVLVLLRGLENTRRLVLDVNSVEHIRRAFDSLECLPTFFSNLEYLELQFDFNKDNIQFITCFLKQSPNLKRLVANKYRRGFDYEEGWEVEEFPLDHLKVVEIRSINGSTNEVNFAKFFLKNAAVLEMLIIRLYDLPAPQMHKISKELLRAPRASSGVAIVIL